LFTYKKDFYKLFIVDTMVWVSASVCMPFMNAYYTQHNITTFQIGMLAAMAPIAALFIQPFWAFLSDRTGRRRTLLQLLVVATGFAYLLYLTGDTYLVFVLAALAVMVFNCAIMPLLDAIITKEAREKNVNFAIVRMGGTVGFAIMVFGVGRYLATNPTHMFVIATCMYALFAASCFMLPKDNPAKEKAANTVTQTEKAPKKRLNLNIMEIFDNKEIVFVLVIAVLMQFALAFHGSFSTVLVVNMGYDQSMVGIMLCVSAFSEVPILLVIHKLMKRFDTLSLLIFALALSGVRIILMTTGNIYTILLSQCLQGPTYMISHYGSITYISAHAREGKMSQAQSILVLLQTGIAAVAGSFVGGVISTLFGLRISFVIMSFFTFASAGACYLALRAYKTKQENTKIA